MKQFTYRTKGVCSQEIKIDLEGDIVKKVTFVAGCNGNLQGISRLVIGMPVDDVINRLKDIKCGTKNTSCPDQLAAALGEIRQKRDV